ncbi:MAG: hypothetical protein L6Q76_27075 [Polyangiaceae bacterium]|nr:hypothetical protein [Polyangiaceae bacterium]
MPDELGPPLFRLLIAYYSDLGADIDCRSMITQLALWQRDGACLDAHH